MSVLSYISIVALVMSIGCVGVNLAILIMTCIDYRKGNL